MSKHTPGPWEVKGKVNDSIVAVRRNADGKATGYTFIATTPILTQNAPFTDDERHANARLIAAAPDLLHALIVLNDADTDSRWDGGEYWPKHIKEMVESAIAKATGDKQEAI